MDGYRAELKQSVRNKKIDGRTEELSDETI